jgi:hypothetical protein
VAVAFITEALLPSAFESHVGNPLTVVGLKNRIPTVEPPVPVDIAPVTPRLLPVAAPITGVISVGLVWKTRAPVPVSPPVAVTVNVPVDVMGELATVNPVGMLSPTLVTVPGPLVPQLPPGAQFVPFQDRH